VRAFNARKVFLDDCKDVFQLMCPFAAKDFSQSDLSSDEPNEGEDIGCN
jgi:hypothetical protein